MRKQSIFALIGAAALAAFGVMLFEKQVKAAPPSNASQLLANSHAIVKRMNCDVDRVWYLGDLIKIASKIDPQQLPKGQVEAWGQELLSLSLKTQDPDLAPDGRLASAKNAATYISMVNPGSGMQILAQLAQRHPERDIDGDLSEDVRAYASIRIFDNYWRAKGSSALPDIEATARQIGKTGEYPYQSISTIIAALAGSGPADDRPKATGLFKEGVDAFLHRGEYDADNKYAAGDRNEEFLKFLQNTKNAVDADVFEDALHQFVAKVRNTQSAASAPSEFSAEIQTSEGPVRLTSESDAVLFHAFQLIRETDSALAQELQSRVSVLDKANARIDFEAAAYGPKERVDSGLQEGLLLRIRNMKDINTDVALRMTSKLTGPRHTKALALVLPSIAQSDGAKAKQLYVEELKAFADFNAPNVTPEDKPTVKQMLEAKVAIAEAAFYAQDFNNFQAYAAQACVEVTKALNEADDHITD